ncbi:MAG: phosphatase PAP2 family protein [Prevotella sp.]
MRIITIIAMMLMASVNAKAQGKFVERSTDVLGIVPTMTGLCIAIVNEDKKGAVELGLSTATALMANYALEAAIKKERPDGSGNHAFPSTHSMLAFNGSTFLMKRYGWKWGVPAYAVSAYVAWGRTHADKHDWWDVLGGAALGAGVSLIYTHKLCEGKDVTIAPAILNGDAKGITARIVF